MDRESKFEYIDRRVIELDQELFIHGVDLEERFERLPRLLMSELGYQSYSDFEPQSPEELDRVRDLLSELYEGYKPSISPGIGIYLFNDHFIRINAPIILGKVKFDVLSCISVNDLQKSIIQESDALLNELIDQFSDAYDVFSHLNEVLNVHENDDYAMRLADISRMHLYASIALLTGGFDHRPAIQSAVLAVELSLKAALANAGWSEDRLRKLRHNNAKILKQITAERLSYDVERLSCVIAGLPDLVANRYGDDTPNRYRAGLTCAGAQFAVGELARHLSGRSFGDQFRDVYPRKFPQKFARGE